MAEVSTKPYLIRAIFDWCTDAGFTPHVGVAVDASVRVPMEFVKNGEIVLNVSMLATSRLNLGNDAIEFQARFGGVARDIYVPIDRVLAIYARENGQGMAFEVQRGGAQDAAAALPVAEQPQTRPSIVVAPSASVGVDADPAPPTPPTGPRERPKLTRIK
jgi:stringent starvation protein B